jgi:DNA-binding response OmpR family regulator
MGAQMAWHLLVVDDEPVNLEIIGEYLDDPGFLLTNAHHGEEAWSALLAAESTATPFDLIILDRMMPVLNGLDLLKRVKADRRFMHLPVIMQTAASAPEQIREGLNAGAYYYLTKPYEPNALVSIVRAVLADIAEQRQAEALSSGPESDLDLAVCSVFSFKTLDQAQHLAGQLAMLCPDPAPAAMGLTELLVNAIEHGNLGISYSEKKMLRQNDTWEAEVGRRLSLPEYAVRTAKVSVERNGNQLLFTVEDQGEGFNWQRYLEFEPERAFDPNGRGIAMARHVGFSDLEYRGCGNVVVAKVSLTASRDSVDL